MAMVVITVICVLQVKVKVRRELGLAKIELDAAQKRGKEVSGLLACEKKPSAF